MSIFHTLYVPFVKEKNKSGENNKDRKQNGKQKILIAKLSKIKI